MLSPFWIMSSPLLNMLRICSVYCEICWVTYTVYWVVIADTTANHIIHVVSQLSLINEDDLCPWVIAVASVGCGLKFLFAYRSRQVSNEVSVHVQDGQTARALWGVSPGEGPGGDCRRRLNTRRPRGRQWSRFVVLGVSLELLIRYICCSLAKLHFALSLEIKQSVKHGVKVRLLLLNWIFD